MITPSLRCRTASVNDNDEPASMQKNANSFTFFHQTKIKMKKLKENGREKNIAIEVKTYD